MNKEKDETLDMDRIHAMFEEMRKEKEERLKMDYAEYVEKQGKGNCVEELMAIRKNVIPLKFEACNDDEIPIGASKSGGYPDLPPTIQIPTLCGYTETWSKDGSVEHYEESAMQLVAQINLAEVEGYDKDNKLPKQGMLYIFWSGEIMLYDSSYSKIDFEGENRELYKIIYYDGDLSLLERKKPTAEYYPKTFDGVLDSYRIEPKGCRNEYDASKLEDALYDEEDEDEDALERLLDRYNDWHVDSNKLLGYGTGANVQGKHKGMIHLFQFDFRQGCLWGGYWYIDEKALAEKDFSKTYMQWDMD